MVTKKINHKNVEIENTKIPCKCGCGELIWKFDIKSRERFYKKGHVGKFAREQLKIIWNKGKKNIYSEETLEKMRNKKLGTHFKLGKIGQNAWNKGISPSEEIKKKISVANLHQWKNKKQSETSRRLKLRAKNISRLKIPLKDNCEICGSIKNLQRHHWNYNKPLLVNTLCKECHDIQHIKNFYQSKYGGVN